MSTSNDPASDIQTQVQQSLRAFFSGAYKSEHERDEQSSKVPASISSPIKSNQFSLLQLIRLLGPQLTSEDEELRSKAVSLLSDTLLEITRNDDEQAQDSEQSKAPTPSHLDRQSTRTLSAFFASKIQDGEAVAASIAQKLNASSAPVPASAPSHRQLGSDGVPIGSEMLASSLRALIRLASRKEFGAESAKEVANSLITYFQPRSHPQSIRFILYSLLDVLIARHRAALKTMGEIFLAGYVKLVEGEKDPRNLIYLFAIDRVLLIEFDLSPAMIEKFFDITYCYFPITFKPPLNDPYGITQLDLKTSLRNSLIANPNFAPHAMPLLLEKLTASSGSAKRDTLETLELALPIFGKPATKANEKRLWECLKIEIFHATDDATSICAQRTLTSFLKVLYEDVDPPEGIASKIVAECLNELKFPDKVLASPACSTLVCCIRACPSTSSFAINALVEQQLDLFKDPDEISLRASILNHLGTLFRTMRETYEGKFGLEKVKVALEYEEEKSGNLKFNAPTSDLSSSPTKTSEEESGSVKKPSGRSYVGDKKPLSSFLPRLISAISNGLNSPSYRSSALFCFLHCSNIENLFTYEELKYLILDVNDLLLLSDREDEQSRKLALETLKEISKNDATTSNGRIIEEIVLPNLFDQLPDRMEEVYAQNDNSMQVDGKDQGEIATEKKLKIKLALGSLSKLCNSNPALLDLLIVKISTKLDLCLSMFTSSSIQTSLSLEKMNSAREDNIGYARGLILTLQTVFEERSKMSASSSSVSKPKESETKAKIGFGINKQTSPKEGTKDVLLLRYAKDLPIRLCSLVLASSINLSLSIFKRSQTDSSEGLEPVGTDPQFLFDLSNLLSLLFRSLNKGQQENLKNWLFPVFVSGHLDPALKSFRSLNEALNLSKEAIYGGWKFEPLSLEADKAQKNSIILLASFLTSCDSSIPVPNLSPASSSNLDSASDSDSDSDSTEESTLNWFSHLLKLVGTSTSTLQTETFLSLLETCANKQIGSLKSSGGGGGGGLPKRFDEILRDFWTSEIENKNHASSRTEKAIQAWFSISRGFVVRAHSKGEEMIEKVLDALFEQDVGIESENQPDAQKERLEIRILAAKALGMVAREGGNLRKENGAIVRLLHRQRFFSFILPKLIQGHKASLDSQSTSNPPIPIPSSTSTAPSTLANSKSYLYLLSLSSILPSLPHSLLSTSSGNPNNGNLLSSLLPLLLRMLSLPSSSARTSAAETIGIITVLAAKERSDRNKNERERTLLQKNGKVEILKGKDSGESEKEKVIDGLDILKEQLSGVVKRLSNNVEPNEWNPPSTRVATLKTLSILAKCFPPRDPILHSEAKVVLRVLGGLPPLSQPSGSNKPASSVASSSRDVDVEMTSTQEKKKKKQKKKSGNGVGIDDPKRRVRLEAVEARDAWFYRESASGGD